MKKKLYEALIESVPSGETVELLQGGASWTACRLSGGGVGISARLDVTGERRYPPLLRRNARDAASAVLSDDEREASEALAVVNAALNTPARREMLGGNVSRETTCFQGFELSGRTVGMIGRMSRTAREIIAAGAKLLIFERDPKQGDLPESEEEKLLPACDIVIASATTVPNHTLPQLLESAQDAKFILLGPSAPLCPELISGGFLTRISGQVVARKDEFMDWNEKNHGSPTDFCEAFLI